VPVFPFITDIIRHISVAGVSVVLYYYGAIFTSISLFSLMAKKWHNLISIAAAVLLSGAIYLLPFSTDLKHYPIRGPVFLTFSIIILLIAIVLIVIRVILRIKQLKTAEKSNLVKALLLDGALFLTSLTAALSVCDIAYDIAYTIYNKLM